jgi:hypothetical protein
MEGTKVNSFETELRDQTVTVTIDHVCPAEPDVGIFQRYADDWQVTGQDGRPIDDLTEEEIIAIDEEIADFLYEETDDDGEVDDGD